MSRLPARRRLLRGLAGVPLAACFPSLIVGRAVAADVPAVVAAAKPSVVAVGVHAPLQNPKFRFLGTGFVVGDGRKVVTCAHVVPTLDPAKREAIAIAVPLADGARIHPARAASLDRDHDLAVLEFEGGPLPALALASPDEVREGADVLVMGFPIGNALGLFAASHRGIIAAITPNVVPATTAAGLQSQNLHVMRGAALQLLQLDATAYPGNSGGPLIDAASGKVAGVMSFGLAKGGKEGALQYPTGISYAIPSRYVSALLERR